MRCWQYVLLLVLFASEAAAQTVPISLEALSAASVASFRTDCPNLPTLPGYAGLRCEPEQIAAIDENLYYAVYGFCDDTVAADDPLGRCIDKMIVVFQGDNPMPGYSKMLKPRFVIPYRIYAEFLIQPKLIDSVDRTILLIQIADDGNARSVTDFAFDHSDLTRLDVLNWFTDIAKPPVSEYRHGGWIDYTNLTTSIFWHLKGDGNCCNTGGQTDVKLEWKGDKLAVKESHYSAQ